VKVPTLKQLGTNSALDPLIYTFLGSGTITVLAAFFQRETFLHVMLVIDCLLVLSLIAAYFMFAFRDPDRLAPPSHQRYMAKLLLDERRTSGMIIDGTITSNTQRPDHKALEHG